MEESEDPYELLGLPRGVDGAKLDESEIRKAYRRRALECHPDKRPNDATAAAQFNRIQHAYEVLSDASARKAYDELQVVRHQREEKRSQMDAKRRKMVDELRQREAVFEAQRKQKTAEDNAAKRLQEELARIRAKNAQKNATAAANGVNISRQAESILSEEESEKTLKVTWDLMGKPGYDGNSLRWIFERFGRVEDVIILPKKKTAKKGSALVVMESASAANAATQMQCGDRLNPLLVIPLGLTSENIPRPEPAPAPAPRASDFEDTVLRKLKEAEERKRIRKQQEEAAKQNSQDEKTANV